MYLSNSDLTEQDQIQRMLIGKLRNISMEPLSIVDRKEHLLMNREMPN